MPPLTPEQIAGRQPARSSRRGRCTRTAGRWPRLVCGRRNGAKCRPLAAMPRTGSIAAAAIQQSDRSVPARRQGSDRDRSAGECLVRSQVREEYEVSSMRAVVNSIDAEPFNLEGQAVSTACGVRRDPEQSRQGEVWPRGARFPRHPRQADGRVADRAGHLQAGAKTIYRRKLNDYERQVHGRSTTASSRLDGRAGGSSTWTTRPWLASTAKAEAAVRNWSRS